MSTAPYTASITGQDDRDFQRLVYRLRQSPLSILGLIMVVFVLLVALVGPMIVPFPQDATGGRLLS
jgi:peptide/nickel transport system permease protein